MSNRFLTERRVPEYRLTYLLRGPDARHRFGVNVLAQASTPAANGRLWSGGRDSTVRLWDLGSDTRDSATGLPTASCVGCLEGHVDWVTDLVEISAEVLVSGSSDTTLKVWNVRDRTCNATLSVHTDYVKAVSNASFSGGSLAVASASLDGRVLVWDLEQAKPVVEFGGPLQKSETRPSMYCLSGSKTSPCLVSGSTNRTISVWDSRTGDLEALLRGHSDGVRCLAAMEGGHLLLSGASDSTVRLWDLRQQRCVQYFETHSDSIWALSAAASFEWFLSGSRDGEVYQSNVKTGDTTQGLSMNYPKSRDKMILSMALVDKEESVWVSTAGSTIAKYNLMKDKAQEGNASAAQVENHTTSHPLNSVAELTGIIPGYAAVTGYKIMNNRRHVLTIDSNDVIELWDITSGRVLKEFGAGKPLEDIAKGLEKEIVIPSWFSVDISLGSVAIRLDKSSCFNAEVYAIDAGLECQTEDAKVNIGGHVLDALLAKLTHARGLRSPPSEAPPYPAYKFVAPVPVILTEEGSPVPVWRVMSDRFTGSEKAVGWIDDYLGDERSKPHRETQKASFQIRPAEGADLPAFEQPKLSAPLILRTKKILEYISGNAGKDDEDWRRFRQGRPSWQDLEVICNDRVVPESMSIAAIRHFIWKSPEELELAYRRKQN